MLWAEFAEFFEFFEGNYIDCDGDFFEVFYNLLLWRGAAVAAGTIRSRPRATGSGRQCLV